MGEAMINDLNHVCKLHSGLCAQINSLEIRIGDLTKLLDLQIFNMEKAVNVAKDTLNIRLDSMNEFRGQLNDQSRSFVTRTELSVHVDKLETKLTLAEKAVNEKFELILKPISEKLSKIEACYNQKVGARAWEVAIITSALSGLVFLLFRYMFKF